MTVVDDVLAGDAGAGERAIEVIRRERSNGASPTLDQLAGAAAANEGAALQVLLRATIELRLAERAARSVLLDSADVDDAVQNTLIALFDKISQFEGRAAFSSWLYSVARNEAVAVLRRKKPGVAIDEEHPGFVERLSSIVADQVRVRRAIDELPDHHREVIELREMQRLPYDEIARRLGVEVGTVRSRLSRAREALAVLLGTTTAP